jgi:hypothetical protein
VRVYRNLMFVQQANDVVLYTHEQGRYQKIAALPLSGVVRDIKLVEDMLYVSMGRDILAFDVSDAARPALSARYPLINHIVAITPHKGTLYLSGETTVTALKLLPALTALRGNNHNLIMALPKDFPLGSYHIAVQSADDHVTIQHNALRVAMPRYSKPKFTLEDLKRVMDERKKSGGLSVPQP